ncbi:MAG: family 16 glycosylhydrolase [Bacteroidota bacterium]
MLKGYFFIYAYLMLPALIFGQAFQDDFEGSGNIDNWFGDDCEIQVGVSNPVQASANTSENVLVYNDVGGTFANVRFEVDEPFDLQQGPEFTLKIYVPSSGVTGDQPNQVSLKLQDGSLTEPWSTQTEIIKPLVLDQWQVVSFNFATDAFINLDPNSLAPLARNDFNRVVIQVNGEFNNDFVTAYIDDFFYSGEPTEEPIYTQLIWSDEFDTDGAIDPGKWFHQTQIPVGDSWFNGEIQHYTDRLENAFVEDGVLHITARRENYTDQGVTKQFTSARLNSKFAFTYGRVEIRAKLPRGIGTWPALWMLGKNITENGAYWQTQGFGTTPWPACGEIDIMEHWGDNQNFVQSAMHTPSSFGNTVNKGGQIIPTASDAFHVYELVWSPEKMIFSVDGVPHYTYDPDIQDADTWPFDLEQYLVFNVAILPIIQSDFTGSAMEIDYVRVYGEASPSSTSNLNVDATPLAYPNPFQDRLTIEFPEANGKEVDIEMFRSDGQLVRQLKAVVSDGDIKLLGLSDLADGSYQIQYSVENIKGSLLVVKKNR